MDLITLAAAKSFTKSYSRTPIVSSIVNDIFKCATSYLNHKDELLFTDDGDGCLFDDDFDISKKYIDCSSMMQAWVQGIPYETSRYNGLDNNVKKYGYGITLPKNPYSVERPSRYYTHELANLFDDAGFCFKPNSDYSNISPGDIIFVSFKTKAGQNFHENAYMKIDHCLMVLGFKDDTHLTCLHTSEASTIRFYDVCVKPSLYDSSSTNSYNDAIVLVARLPFFQTSPALKNEAIALDGTKFVTTSTSSGFMKTITLDTPLLTNHTYTAIIKVKNAFPQTSKSVKNYLGLRAVYESEKEDETIVSWQYNEYPENDTYEMKFVTGEDVITGLKIYILENTVSGHEFMSFCLHEGIMANYRYNN